MERITKSFFSEKDAMPFANMLAALWPKKIAMNWFWLGFQALEKAGMTYYETEAEEIIVREKLTLLAVFYYEFCYIAGYSGNENFSFWDAEMINAFKKDLSAEANAHLCDVRTALINYFGNEEEVIAELWINCMEGYTNSFISLKEKVEIYTRLINGNVDDVYYKDVSDWFIGWGKNLDDFETISI